jgi:hypothetical protein
MPLRSLVLPRSRVPQPTGGNTTAGHTSLAAALVFAISPCRPHLESWKKQLGADLKEQDVHGGRVIRRIPRPLIAQIAQCSREIGSHTRLGALHGGMNSAVYRTFASRRALLVDSYAFSLCRH